MLVYSAHKWHHRTNHTLDSPLSFHFPHPICTRAVLHPASDAFISDFHRQAPVFELPLHHARMAHPRLSSILLPPQHFPPGLKHVLLSEIFIRHRNLGVVTLSNYLHHHLSSSRRPTTQRTLSFHCAVRAQAERDKLLSLSSSK